MTTPVTLKFSYSGDPSKSDKDKVRFLIGDTDANAPLLGDPEITYLITEEGTPVRASIAAAVAISAKFSRLSDESVGDVSKSYSQRAEQYKKLADQLRQRQAEKSVCPYAGGISVADKQSVEGNTDRVDPAFYRDLHNNPRTGMNDEDDDYNQ